MIHERMIYSIYDKGAEEFGPVFSASNDVVAERNFKDIIKTSPYLEEFELYRLGKVIFTHGPNGQLQEDFKLVVTDFESYNKETYKVIEGGKKDA